MHFSKEFVILGIYLLHRKRIPDALQLAIKSLVILSTEQVMDTFSCRRKGQRASSNEFLKELSEAKSQVLTEAT